MSRATKTSKASASSSCRPRANFPPGCKRECRLSLRERNCFRGAKADTNPMSELTRILSRIESGDPQAAEQLLPLVYDELRKLAAQRLTQEKPGQTLQPTALVHEAYLKLVDADQVRHWDSRGHFFAAAAEAMRRLLID